MTTVWGQGDGYNNLAPLSCSYSYYNGYKAPTGCVATAMAQVLRYFQKPYTYNWTNMPNYAKYANGTYDLQLLMKNAGTAVNMNYGCSASGAYDTAIAPAFINYFHYTSASKSNFNLNTVVQNLNNGKPIILAGSGHAWVCDGYLQTTFYSLDQDGNCTGVTYYPVLHMNWGWDNDYNAYYSVGNFNPGGGSGYNNNLQMIYNINL